MLPEGAVWDAVDAYVGEEGTLHKRGSTVTALSSGTVASASVLAIVQNEAETSIIRGYIIDESPGAGNVFLVYAFTPASGTFAATAVAANSWVSSNGVGRPFQHDGFAIVPTRAPATVGAGSSYRSALVMAGSTAATYSSTTNLTVTAGAKTVTGFSAGDISNMQIGQIVWLAKNAANDLYYGRITNISGTTAYVYPTPTQSFTTGTGTWFMLGVGYTNRLASLTTHAFRGTQCGASWQNRVLFGAPTAEIAAGVTNAYTNRVVWSLLPTELSASNPDADGALWMDDNGFPTNNYADVPWMNKILGMEPVSDGELLVLGNPICSRLVGTLNTNTSTSGGLTYELRPLNQRIPCIDDRATVRTPQGVMMMGPDGIYLYREGNLINTMVGRIQNLFLDTYASATVYGAGVLPSNHYYLSTDQGLLLCNMDGFRWTRFQNTLITNAFNDPSATTRVFSCRYQPGTASNTTKLLRVDQFVNPSSSATTDVSGTGPLMTVKTKTYTDGDASRLKQFRHEEVTVRMPGSTGTVTVTSQPGLDGEETGATLGTFSNATSAASKRFDTTTLSRAMGLQIAQTGNPDECELIDIDIAARPARLGRVS